ncbi:MAG: T9SS type A sorting domain-containing protein, partial [Bacteroidales bacterium]|nr:T9SS type A sorting domain-containing protein [Bacteroidales bacterium]
VSLVIHSSQARLVRDVRMAEGLGGILSWSVEGDELRIGWYSLEAVDMRAGSELFYIVFAKESASALSGLRFDVRDNSELSNGAGEAYGYQKLSYPELLIPANANGNTLSLWPNPATATVNLQLSTTQSGQARIELLDALGRSVRLIHSGALENGQHNWSLDVSGLPAGTYLLHTTGVSGVSTQKLIVVR